MLAVEDLAQPAAQHGRFGSAGQIEQRPIGQDHLPLGVERGNHGGHRIEQRPEQQ